MCMYKPILLWKFIHLIHHLISNLRDSSIHLPLLDVVPSIVVMGVTFDPLVHSLHDHSLQIDMSVDTYGQQSQ